MKSNNEDPLLGDTWRRIWAFEMSLNQATGGKDCYPNIPAACWFWFTGERLEFVSSLNEALQCSLAGSHFARSQCTSTISRLAGFALPVMTTIGYGNNSPESPGGRIMVYTLGFVALILFGGVSARAAVVITSLSDDLLIRSKLRRWVSPVGDAVMWGVAYFLYLVPLGAYYIGWQSKRLGPLGVQGLNEGFWFSHVSITTARAKASDVMAGCWDISAYTVACFACI
jgi:Ion channel